MSIFDYRMFAIKVGIIIIGCSNGCGNAGKNNNIDTIESAETDSLTAETDSRALATDSGKPTDNSKVYAHVTAVTIDGDSNNYTFSVTVESADVDCSQFADWWEVVSETGELRYRRILAHSHTDENGTGNPFTRSGGPVPIAPDETVIIRAHMNTVGYRGNAMIGSVTNGFETKTDLAADFGAALEKTEPLPTDCAF